MTLPSWVRALVSLALLLALARRASAAEPAPATSTAGWHRGTFYLRDPSDTIRLYPQGRIHIDGVAPFGRGISQLSAPNALLPTLLVRRARAELSGEVGRLQFTLQIEQGATAIENVGGRTATLECSPDPGGGRRCVERTAAVDAPVYRTQVINAFVNVHLDDLLNVQVGQFRVPFSFENRTGINFLPFHERSMPVRIVGGATGREIGAMVWGETPGRETYYSLGLFGGDGNDRPNVDRRVDVIGRAVAHPFGGLRTLKHVHVGFSGRAGSRDPRYVGYDLPSMVTQAGYSFFRTTYRDSDSRVVHVIPSGLQRAFGAEVLARLARFDFTAEYIRMAYDTREDLDGLQHEPGSLRQGRLSGGGWYGQVGWWVLGPREVIPSRGEMRPFHLDFSKTSAPVLEHAVEVIARVQQLRLRYDASLREGTDDPRTPSGRIAVDGLGLGVNYWATRHLRVSANYLVFAFPDSAPIVPSHPGGPTQTSRQRAIAPAQLLEPGVNDAARDGSHVLHEVSARVGVQF